MLVSYNWLNSYFNKKLPSAREVVEKLVTHSFEIEGLDKNGSDWVINIDVLPNRGSDALSHNGIAKELGVILDMEPSIPNAPNIYQQKSSNGISIKIEVPEGAVRRVNKILMKNVSISESPDWLKERLSVLGQQPINNIVDATNYIMLETGQPIHAFDYDKLSGEKKEMFLRFAKEGEELELLDGKRIVLDTQTMVWADSEKALDIAGIKGGAVSRIDENTKNIVLSACNFNPVMIRKTRQRTKVMTDASKRFEQDITAELTLPSIARAAQLIVELATGEAQGVVDIYPKKEKRRKASVDVQSINSILGTDLKNSDIEHILDKFKHAGFEWSKHGETYTVVAPYERRDINLKHDVIEEIGRVYGYNNIESRLPDTTDFLPQVNRNFYFITKLKKLFIKEGWSEIYNYIMVENGEVEIANSLVEGMDYLRVSTKESLRKNLEDNIKHAELLGLEQIKLFEVGKVFNRNGEHWAIGIGVKNHTTFKGANERREAEKIIEKINTEFGVANAQWNVEDVSVPTQDNPHDIGVVAEFNLEKAVENIPLPNSYEDLVVKSKKVVKYKPISAYPFVLRDIAVWVPEGISVEDLLNEIKNEAGKFLVQTSLFDEFKKERQTSYAFRLVFQSQEKTLSGEEVGKIMEKITQKIEKNSNWMVR